MKSGDEPPVFPYSIIWEEFAPSAEVSWETLEAQSDEYEALFAIAKSGKFEIPFVDKTMIEQLASETLGRAPSEPLVSRLHLLAGWQISGEFRKEVGIDLRGQHPALKRLEVAAFELWQASGWISGHVAAILPWLHAVEPERLLPRGRDLDVHDIGIAAYDLSLAAARAYQDTKPKKTGRRPDLRRDSTVRFAATICCLLTRKTAPRKMMLNCPR